MAKLDFDISKHENKIDWIRDKQRYIYLFVVGIVSIQLFFIMIRPKMAMLSSEKEILAGYEKSLSVRKGEALNVKRIESEIWRLRKEVVKTKEWFFTRDEYSQFSITTLPQIASAIGVRIGKITYGDSQLLRQAKGVDALKNKMKIFPIDLNIDGEFLAVMRFIQEMENYDVVVKVGKFSMNRRSADPVLLNVKLSLEAYVSGE